MKLGFKSVDSAGSFGWLTVDGKRQIEVRLATTGKNRRLVLYLHMDGEWRLVPTPKKRALRVEWSLD